MSDQRYLHVRAKAGAKKEMVEQRGSTSWTIHVRDKPERGAANERIKEILAEYTGVRREELRLVKGATSPSKLFVVITHS